MPAFCMERQGGALGIPVSGCPCILVGRAGQHGGSSGALPVLPAAGTCPQAGVLVAQVAGHSPEHSPRGGRAAPHQHSPFSVSLIYQPI